MDSMFCNDCLFLSCKDPYPDVPHEYHRCYWHKVRVFHRDAHPNIYRDDRCLDDWGIKNEIQ